MTDGADPHAIPAGEPGGSDASEGPAPSVGGAASAAPQVSVVIICFNDEERLSEAIRSAQDQSLADIEIVIVDHGRRGCR